MSEGGKASLPKGFRGCIWNVPFKGRVETDDRSSALTSDLWRCLIHPMICLLYDNIWAILSFSETMWHSMPRWGLPFKSPLNGLWLFTTFCFLWPQYWWRWAFKTTKKSQNLPYYAFFAPHVFPPVALVSVSLALLRRTMLGTKA